MNNSQAKKLAAEVRAILPERSTTGEVSDALHRGHVDIANRAQAVTGYSIWPSTVKAILEAAALPVAAPMGGDAVVELLRTHIAELRKCAPLFRAFHKAMAPVAAEFEKAADELEAALAATPAPPPAMQAEIDRLRVLRLAERLGQQAEPRYLVQPGGCKYTPEEVGRMLANRVVQPHYAAFLVRKAIAAARARDAGEVDRG